MSNPNTKNRQVQTGHSYLAGATFAHPEYSYWQHAWRQLRDTYLGDEEMRRKASLYIPMLETMDQNEYAAYVQRAVFYNMVGKTVNGMHGTLFRRPPKVKNVPQRLQEDLETIGRDGASLLSLSKTIGREVISMGRYGVLMDRDEDPALPPYLTGYIAENIISWTVEVVKGKYQLTEVVLREIEARKTQRFGSHVTYFSNFRVLKLERDPETREYVYVQHFFEADEKSLIADLNGPEAYTVMPSNRGVPFDYIPFIFFGATENTAGVDKSPVLDIAKINISHYQTTAHLEHGRFYTGLPIYYVQVGENQEANQYELGPSTVWEVEPGQRPGVIEFNGTGLSTLERALNQKEHQIAALGGRIVGVMANATAESADITAMKERNEASILLTITSNIADGLTKLIRWWARWNDATDAEVKNIEFRMSRDFLFDIGSSREFRAMQAMYKDGVIPVEVFHDYMRRSDVISEDMSVEEFKALLETPQSFPNQLEVQARLEGYPDAKTMWEDQNGLLEPEAPMSQDADVLSLRAAQNAVPETAPVVAPVNGAVKK